MPNAASHRRRRALAVGVLVVVILASTGCRVARAGRGCRGGVARDATHVLVCANGRWVRLATFADVLVAVRDSRLPRVLLLGDSIARSLETELGETLRPRGFRYEHRTYPCGVVEGNPTEADGTPWQLAATCNTAVPMVQSQAIAQLDPALVVVISSWETTDRSVDGVWHRFATPEADAVLLGLYRRTVDRLTASGARVVFVTVPDHVGSQLQPVQPERTARARHLNALLDEVGRTDPARVSIVRMDDIVCPTDPCPDVVEGLGLRSVDGIHFNGRPEASYVAQRLADRLVSVPLGNQDPNG